MRRIIAIGKYYLAINLLKRFNDKTLQLMKLDNTILYVKKDKLNILVFHLNSDTRMLNLHLYDHRWKLQQYEIIRLSKQETSFFLNLAKALDDEIKR